ncbi:MAG: cation diffusion facilitator family transporter [Acidobacteria bacterium]|nr:cation diffusion facilitator family transporter [Acidobacteriota bacterium]
MSGGRSTPLAAGLISVGVGVFVLVLKILAAVWTSSLILLSDALESVVNVVAAAVAAGAIRYGSRPADSNHPWGHAKIEYFSAGIEGTLVTLAAVTIGWQAVIRFGQQPRLPELGLGLAVSFAATLANLGLSEYLARVGRRHRSPALEADALHVRSDVWTSVAAYVGFAIAWATGRWELDALVALAVAGHILGAGIKAMRTSFGGLMDEGLPPAERAEIGAMVAAEGPPVVEHHDLRARRTGADLFVELHLVVEGETPVIAAHAICDRLEAAIRELHPGARVTIHVEPEGEAQVGAHRRA